MWVLDLSQFVLSGIRFCCNQLISLKIDDEYLKVTEVGFSSTPSGVINDSTDVSLGNCDSTSRKR